MGLMLMTKEKAADKARLLGTRDVKGVALKTHEGRCPSTLRAFKKARAKLLIVFRKSIS